MGTIVTSVSKLIATDLIYSDTTFNISNVLLSCVIEVSHTEYTLTEDSQRNP